LGDMGTLIPDLDGRREANQAVREVGACLAEYSPPGCRVFFNPPDQVDRPRFVLIDDGLGVLAVDVFEIPPEAISGLQRGRVALLDGRDVDPLSELGRHIEGLRRRLDPDPGAKRIRGFVALPGLDEAAWRQFKLDSYFPARTAAAIEALRDGRWLAWATGPDRASSPGEAERIAGLLYPEDHFEQPRRPEDLGFGERTRQRFQLDAEQEAIARTLSSGVTVLTGVSGSGKSLVLCARARVLATEHPEWTILMLVFNRALLSYLRGLVGPLPNVSISTFHQWAKEDLQIQLPALIWDKSYDKAIERARRAHVGMSTYDAIMIDEGQDFADSWLRLARSSLIPGRGGLVVAADLAQSLYRETTLATALGDTDRDEVSLTHNYRNTEEIGRLAYASVFGKRTSGRRSHSAAKHRMPDEPLYLTEGSPVQLVWAENWNLQAESIAWEIGSLVEQGDYQHNDIAVLYTQRRGMAKRLRETFAAAEIPFFWVNESYDSRTEIDLEDDSVKLVTVHSAKGMDFPVVFLFGLEALRAPSDLLQASEAEANRARVAYVGMTRARDLLFLTYTRSNAIVDRLLGLKQWYQSWTYPDDYPNGKD
jgi:UvrD-like helicase C-terminal domain/AAA domain